MIDLTHSFYQENSFLIGFPTTLSLQKFLVLVSLLYPADEVREWNVRDGLYYTMPCSCLAFHIVFICKFAMITLTAPITLGFICDLEYQQLHQEELLSFP